MAIRKIEEWWLLEISPSTLRFPILPPSLDRVNVRLVHLPQDRSQDILWEGVNQKEMDQIPSSGP